MKLKSTPRRHRGLKVADSCRRLRRGTEVRPRLQSESHRPVRRDRVGAAHRGDHRRLRQGDLQAGERRGAESRGAPLATKIAVSKYFYGDIAQRQRSLQRRPRALGEATRASRHAHDHRLRDQGRLFRGHGKRGDFLQRTDLALRESVRRVQLAGLVQRRPLAPIQSRRGPRRGELLLRSRDRRGPRARRRSTSIRRAARASSSRVDDTMEDIMRLAHVRGDALQIRLAAPAAIFPRSARTREKLSGGGKPSGPLSFLKVYDQVAQRREIRRQDAARGEDEHAQGLASGHRGIHRGQDQGGEEGVGADRAGLRRQLQRRGLRLDHVSEREPLGARERRIHERRDRRPRVVDASA